MFAGGGDGKKGALELKKTSFQDKKELCFFTAFAEIVDLPIRGFIFHCNVLSTAF